MPRLLFDKKVARSDNQYTESVRLECVSMCECVCASDCYPGVVPAVSFSTSHYFSASPEFARSPEQRHITPRALIALSGQNRERGMVRV